MGSSGLTFGSRSLAAMAILLVITQAFHPRMLLLLVQGQNAGWILMLLGTITAIGFTWPIAAILQRTGQRDLIDLARAGLGRWATVLLALVLVTGTSFVSGMIVRETSEMAISAVFPHTPQTLATVSLLAGAVYVAVGDSASLVRLGRVLLPWVLVAILLVLAGSIGWGEFRYLLPLWGPGLPRLVSGIPDGTVILAPATVTFYLTGQVADRSRLTRWLLLAPLFAGLIMILEKVVLSMVFAYPIGWSVPFPLHTAARLLLGGRFFERVEGLWVFTWVVATIFLLGALIHTGARAYCKAFSINRRLTAVLPLTMVALTVAFFPPDQATTLVWHNLATPLIFAVWYVVPLLLALAAALRLPRRAA